MTKYIIIGHARSVTTVTSFLLRDNTKVSALWNEVDYSHFYDKGVSACPHEYDKNEKNHIYNV